MENIVFYGWLVPSSNPICLYKNEEHKRKEKQPQSINEIQTILKYFYSFIRCLWLLDSTTKLLFVIDLPHLIFPLIVSTKALDYDIFSQKKWLTLFSTRETNHIWLLQFHWRLCWLELDKFTLHPQSCLPSRRLCKDLPKNVCCDSYQLFSLPPSATLEFSSFIYEK